ncbi:hypothetical protein [Pseudomonas sp. 10S4]|uniref:hypothetical protein n=1 Tax=Pseudomonas sp. 10S4 TaxID=3048583 RepID=UPI002AC8A165|nr:MULTISPECIES: hypothetical protein [unclassified Pseudomonas]MEB0223605.1 hypothetical protein [Pseudomonas sp. 5S1]MEB0297753.1 hypothetical protein [Pseudomonas sp. 10S4]WPX21045.1 hypothetical protein RHM58_15005 [Pseudomonas sp. 10S4]
MNFDQAKALRLQQWRSTLDNPSFRVQNPEAYRQTLHSMSQGLAAEGLIDKLEQFDMDELANAAYWHVVEELHDSPPRYCGASSYDVMAHGKTELFGRIGRSIFHFASSLAAPSRTTYDGKIYPDGDGANLVFNASKAIARITGLTLTMPDGTVCDLVETQRVVDGVTYEPIEDPDLYRVLVDTAQVAQENQNLRTFEKVRPLLDLARFHTCPSCLDRFGQRDDCPTCAGKGFVTKQVFTGLR